MTGPSKNQFNGRETVYLISAETFHQLWASYRRAGSTLELTDAEMALMDEAQVPAEQLSNKPRLTRR